MASNRNDVSIALHDVSGGAEQQFVARTDRRTSGSGSGSGYTSETTEEAEQSRMMEDDKADDQGDQEDSEEQEDPRTDKGYAWWVLFGSFVCNFLVDGVVFAFGGIYDHLKEHFHATAKDASLVGSLLCGCYLLMGPFTSVLCKQYGCRRITMGGAVLACVSFIVSMFATNIEFLQLSLGVLGGIGFGLIYLPSIVIVGYWFNKKRALATGIAVCGSSLGGFALVPMCSILLEEYDWRGTTLLLGGFVINAAWAGALFRTFEEADSADTKKELANGGRQNGDVKNSNIMTSVMNEKARQMTDSTHSLDNCVITGDNELVKIPSRPTSRPSTRRSSTAEKSKMMVAMDQLAVSDGQLHKIAEDVLRKQRGDSRKATGSTRQSSTAIEAESAVSQPNERPVRRQYSHSVSHSTRLGSDASRAMKEEFLHHRMAAEAGHDDRRRRDFGKSFTGSIAALPMGSLSSIHRRTTANALAHKTPLTVAEIEKKPSICDKALALLHETFDVSLMKSPTMIMIIVSSIMSMLGFFLPFMFIMGIARSVGLTVEESKRILMLLNIANAVGRVIAGWMSDRSCVDVLWTNNLALIFAGAATMCVPLCTNYVLLSVYAVVFGILIAAFVTLRSILLVEVLGLSKLTNAFGWLILFQGFAVIFGPPVGGMFYDATQSYTTTFLFGGSVLTLSGLALIPLRQISNWEKARTKTVA